MRSYLFTLTNIPMTPENYSNEVRFIKQITTNNRYKTLLIDK